MIPTSSGRRVARISAAATASLTTTLTTALTAAILTTVTLAATLTAGTLTTATPAVGETAAAAPGRIATTALRGAAVHSCRGEHVDRSAPVISQADIVIIADPHAVWKAHVRIDRWSRWKTNYAYAYRLDRGPLRVGSRFHYSNGGLVVTSTIRAIVHDRCTLWSGPAAGIQGVHLWTFRPVKGGTAVHTEESWSGAPVDADPARAQDLLDASLAQAVQDMKAFVESRTQSQAGSRAKSPGSSRAGGGR